MKQLVREFLLDTAKIGPKFGFQGLISRMRAHRMGKVTIPKVGQVCIRYGDSDFDTFRQVFRNKDYELPTSLKFIINKHYRSILDSGGRPVIIDAGANVGAASLWFRLNYPEAAVVAVEPDPNNLIVLKKNAMSRNIKVLDAAIGSEEGFVSICNVGESWAVQTTRSDSGLKVVTIEDSLRDIDDGVLFIVKIDIEGFESDLFSRNTEWMDSACAIYMEPHDWLFPGKRTSRNFQREISCRDFEVFIRGENLIYVR